MLMQNASQEKEEDEKKEMHYARHETKCPRVGFRAVSLDSYRTNKKGKKIEKLLCKFN